MTPELEAVLDGLTVVLDPGVPDGAVLFGPGSARMHPRQAGRMGLDTPGDANTSPNPSKA